MYSEYTSEWPSSTLHERVNLLAELVGELSRATRKGDVQLQREISATISRLLDRLHEGRD